MNHIRTLLLLYVLPRNIGHIFQCGSHRIVIVLPADTLKDRIRFGQWRQLEFRWLSMSAKCDKIRPGVSFPSKDRQKKEGNAMSGVLRVTPYGEDMGTRDATYNGEVILRKDLGGLLLLLGVLGGS